MGVRLSCGVTAPCPWWVIVEPCIHGTMYCWLQMKRKTIRRIDHAKPWHLLTGVIFALWGIIFTIIR